jgi:hypothetical protein
MLDNAIERNGWNLKGKESSGWNVKAKLSLKAGPWGFEFEGGSKEGSEKPTNESKGLSQGFVERFNEISSQGRADKGGPLSNQEVEDIIGDLLVKGQIVAPDGNRREGFWFEMRPGDEFSRTGTMRNAADPEDAENIAAVARQIGLPEDVARELVPRLDDVADRSWADRRREDVGLSDRPISTPETYLEIWGKEMNLVGGPEEWRKNIPKIIDALNKKGIKPTEEAIKKRYEEAHGKYDEDGNLVIQVPKY